MTPSTLSYYVVSPKVIKSKRNLWKNAKTFYVTFANNPKTFSHVPKVSKSQKMVNLAPRCQI
jgi:hypothetical protein